MLLMIPMLNIKYSVIKASIIYSDVAFGYLLPIKYNEYILKCYQLTTTTCTYTIRQYVSIIFIETIDCSQVTHHKRTDNGGPLTFPY
jgi:hypothetical protein